MTGRPESAEGVKTLCDSSIQLIDLWEWRSSTVKLCLTLKF